MRRVLLLLLAILVPAFEKDASAQNFIIEKVKEIRLELGDEIVGEVADLTRDTVGNYYLSDWQQHTIWVVDTRGLLIRKIGREGRGPGELTNPRSVALHDGKIYVLDNDNDRIAVFESTGQHGQHIASHRIDTYLASGMLINDDGHVVLSTLLGPSLFEVYDTDGTKQHVGGSRETSGRAIGVIGGSYQLFQHISRTPDGNVLYSPIKRYEVTKLDLEGAVLATYSAEPAGYRPFADAVTPQGGGVRLDMNWSWVGRPLVVDDQVLVQRRNLEDGGISGDLFTPDGSVVQLGISLPFRLLYSSGEDLYGIDTTPLDEGEDNPKIVVYRLVG